MSASTPQMQEAGPGIGALIGTTAVTVVLLGSLALWYRPWQVDRPTTDAGRGAGSIAAPAWPQETSHMYGEVIVSPSGLVVQADGVRTYARAPRKVPGAGADSAMNVVAVPVTDEDKPWVAQLIDEANRIRLSLGLPPLRTVLVPAESPSAD